MTTYAYKVIGEKKKTPAFAPIPTVHAFDEGGNLFIGDKDLEERFGPLTGMELDLLRLAAAVFAADRASARGEREKLSRTLHLQIPVENLDYFLPMASSICRLLHALSQDIWSIKFVQATYTTDFELNGVPKVKAACKTLLFSGGLDSLAAAVEFSSKDSPLLLVSHKTRNPTTDNAQKELVTALTAAGRNILHIQAFVSSQSGGPTQIDHDVEPSQRTRSFVFLTLAAICARRTGHYDVLMMAENGQMAIHLPLTTARIGAFSTRTAHPTVLRMSQDLLGSALDFNLVVRNPYLYLTKAEVVRVIREKLPTSIPLSTSCWKNARPLATGVHHCGECVPCIMRRIAVEFEGNDATGYARDVLSADVTTLTPTDEGRRNLFDIAEFVALFGSRSPDELKWEFPELISPHLDFGEAVKMYQRFARESRAVFQKYPGLKPLLS